MLVASKHQDAATGGPFRVAVHPHGSHAVVAPARELDLATVPQLELELTELRRAGVADIVLDLRALTFVDSSGLNLLLHQHRAAQTEGHRFRLVDGPEATRRLFELTGTTEEFDFVAGS